MTTDPYAELREARDRVLDAIAAIAALSGDPHTVHACPPGDADLTPCCHRTPLELPADERITLDDGSVTCTGRRAQLEEDAK